MEKKSKKWYNNIKGGENMIVVRKKTRDAKEIVINADLIEAVEANPDTIITLINGNKIMVQESIEDIVKLVIEYKKKIKI